MKTAVEWLVDEYFGGIENCTPDFRFHIQQALAMEKEQRLNQNKTELNDALREFQKKYPSVTSGDLQTFILGLQAAQSNPI